jgi:cephalosporin-C deacetylase-like acetyl esterase
MSDHSGILAGRQSGWPRACETADGKPESQKAFENMAYYDDVFFGRRIKCPIYTCTGFIDTVCSRTSVYAFYNNLPKDTFKSMTTTPTAPHTAGEKYFGKALDDYLANIRKGLRK